jgi:hypothetical protein
MDVHVDEMTSTVRATDSGALLDPRVMERIVGVVLERVREEREHAERVAEERGITASVAAEESFPGGG